MKKEELKKFHRLQIQNSAEKLFDQFGVAETSVDRIAKLAEYSKATVYVYFDSKEEIFYSIVLKFMKEICKEIESIFKKNLSFKEKYFELCNYLVAFQKLKPLYFEGMIGNINMQIDNPNTPRTYVEIFEVGNKINDNLMKLLRQGIDEKLVEEKIDCEKTLLFMWSTLTGLIRMTSQKADYFLLNNVEHESILKFGFEKLLDSILKHKE